MKPLNPSTDSLGGVATGAAKRPVWVLSLLIPVLFFLNLAWGSVTIPLNDVLAALSGDPAVKESFRHIVLDSRLPQAVTALLAGAALAGSGLLLQTLFRNPLADPSILGISSGANLGAALVLLGFGHLLGRIGDFSVSGHLALIMGALVGALAILALIIWFSSKVANAIALLIIGIMISYMTSSAITLLNFFSTSEGVRSFVLWGMGDFSGTPLHMLPLFSGAILIGLSLALLQMKPLNALLLGDQYAANLGIRVKRVRILILLCTGWLTAVVTAFCGPISFIGLAVPHVARMLLHTSNHARLLPATLLSGSGIALLCNLLTHIPVQSGIFPLGAITPLLGAPVILYVMIRKEKTKFFF